MGLLFNANEYISSTVNYSRTSVSHTVSFWASLTDSGSTRRPFGNTGTWEMRTSGTTLTSDLLQSGTLTTGTLTLNTRHHIAVVPDVTNTDRFFYIDGVLASSNLSATFAGTQTGLMTIGTSSAFLTQGWRGVIDDFRIYERALPIEEVQTIHAAEGNDGIIDDLSHWWPMDEGVEGATVTTLYDVIGGLDLTSVSGSPTYDNSFGIKRRRYA